MSLTLVQHRQIEAAAIAMDDRDLRRELADAITSRAAADASTAAASRTLDKAKHLLCEAGERAARLKASMEAPHQHGPRQCPCRGRPEGAEGRFANARHGARPHTQPQPTLSNYPPPWPSITPLK